MLIGRDAELKTLKAALQSASDGRLARAVRVIGVPGSGKTTLLANFLEQPEANGWLIAHVVCHRIQSALPLFLARRITKAIVQALESDAERYVSQLDISADSPAVFEEAFLRVFEGIALDHRILIVIDDAQWADPQSCELISRTIATFAAHAIVVIHAERSTERASEFDFRDVALPLGDLPEAAALTIARSIYPEANDAVASTILAHSRGNSLDLVTIAEAARERSAIDARDVGESTRRIVARDVALLDSDVRTFLQICSLLEEPIDIALLREIFPKDDLAHLIESASSRYINEGDGALRFTHGIVMESVRETIPIEIPLRRRVIAALEALQNPDVEKLELLVEQARLSGDRSLEQSALGSLANAAMQKQMFSLAASAMERSLAISPPPLEQVVPFYSRLSQLLMVLGREHDGIRVCEAGLALARERGATGIGPLVVSLIIAKLHAGDDSETNALIGRFDSELTQGEDRAQLLSARTIMSAFRSQVDESHALLNELLTFDLDKMPIVGVRAYSSMAFLYSRIGRSRERVEAVREALRRAETLPPLVQVMPQLVSITTEFLHVGTSALESLFTRKSESNDTFDFFRIVYLLARGEIDDLHVYAGEVLGRHKGAFSRRTILGLQATALALKEGPIPTPLRHAIEREIRSFESGEPSNALIAIASAWACVIARDEKVRAGRLLRAAIERLGKPIDPMLLQFPVVLAKAARALNDTQALEMIARRTIHQDLEPWKVAQVDLASALASSYLGNTNSAKQVAIAAEHLSRLGAPFLASHGVASPETGRPFGNVTRREREISALVADGLSNREIAERLVLSERTVEGHIANLFAKLDVNSRTQIAAWYLRATTVA